MLRPAPHLQIDDVNLPVTRMTETLLADTECRVNELGAADGLKEPLMNQPLIGHALQTL